MRKVTLVIFLVLGLVLAAGAGLASDQLTEENHPHAHDGMDSPQDSDYCAGCHACDKPTKDNPCLLGCPRHEGKFLREHVVDLGPDIILIDQLANLYKPVIFAHPFTLGMIAG